MWDTGQSGGAPDSHCSLTGVPSGACSDSARAVRTVHCSLLQSTVGAVVVAPLAHRTVRCYTGQFGATPDSPMNYSGEHFPETRS